MENQFSFQLQNMTKQNKMTQEQLAKLLNVSAQAVSKWENKQAYPDIELLPSIASIFHVSLDCLLGYQVEKLDTTHYEKKYQSDDFYWGNQIWEGCYKVLQYMPPIKRLRLLDMGCGEGQAAVFFAKNSYSVSAFDISESGIEKGIRLAEANHVEVDFFQADINQYQLGSTYDVVFASGVLQYITEDKRSDIISMLKEHTNRNGIHVLNVFVEKPFLDVPPDWEKKEFFWNSGELMNYYHDWKIETVEEIIFECDSSGIAHKHCMDVLIARKII